MKNIKEDGAFNVSPVKKYTSPKYPTYENARGDSRLLKKLPSRWQKNAKVLACLGLIGTFALASHAESPAGYAEANRYGENNGYYLKPADGSFDVTVTIHHGGSGFPFYVVYLTEQEALNIIRTEAAAAGFRFDSVPPDYTVDIMRAFLGDNASDRLSMDVGLNMFDEEKNVALTYINGGNYRGILNMLWHMYFWGEIELDRESDLENLDLAKLITEGFTEHNKDLFVGVLIDRGASRGWDLPDEAKAEMGKTVGQNFTEQVREFIESLRARGILQN